MKKSNYAVCYDDILNGLTFFTMLFIGFAIASIYHSFWWYIGCLVSGAMVRELDRNMRGLIRNWSWAIHQQSYIVR